MKLKKKMLSPLEVAKKEPAFKMWPFYMIACGLSSTICGLFNGNLLQAFSDGTFYTYSIAMLMPLIFERSITGLVLQKKNEKEHFNSIKLFYFFISFVIIVLACLAYGSVTKTSVVVQLVFFVVSSFIAYLFYLCLKMSDFNDLIEEYDDISYLEMENMLKDTIKKSECGDIKDDQGVKL